MSNSELELVLNQLITPDTATIRDAEQHLAKLLRNKTSVLGLFELLKTSTNPAVRQLCAVLIRGKIASFFTKFNAAEQNEIKNLLLSLIFAEPVRIVRLNIVYTTAALGKQLLVSKAGWTDLLKTVEILVTNRESWENREFGFVLLYAISETLSFSLSSFGGASYMAALFKHSFETEPEQKVRIVALRACACLLENLEDNGENENDVLQFKEIIPLLLTSLDLIIRVPSALEEKEEEAIVQTIECLQSLIGSSSPVLHAAVGECVHVLVRVLHTPLLSENIRAIALLTLSDLLETKASVIVKSGELFEFFLNSSIDIAMHALVKMKASRGEEEEDDDGKDGDEAELVAAFFDSICTSFPTKRIFAFYMSKIFDMANESTMESGERALFLFTLVCEGFRDQLSKNEAVLEEVLKKILFFLPSKNIMAAADVTRLACRSLYLLIDACGEEMNEYLATFLPPVTSLFEACASGSVSAQETNMALYSAEACSFVICQALKGMSEEEVVPFLPLLFPSLSAILHTATHAPVHPVILVETIIILSDLMCASRTCFTMERCDACFQLVGYFVNDRNEARVLSRAIEFLGHLFVVSQEIVEEEAEKAEEEGRDAAVTNPHLAHVETVLNLAFSFAELDLRESCFGLCANVCIALRKRERNKLGLIAPVMLDKVLEGLAREEEDEVKTVKISRDTNAAIPDQVRRVLESDDESEGEAEMDENVKLVQDVRTDAADAKTTAHFALQMICEHAPHETVAPYFPRIFSACQESMAYPFATVRAAAVSTLIKVCISFHHSRATHAWRQTREAERRQNERVLYEWGARNHSCELALVPFLPGVCAGGECVGLVDGEVGDILLRALTWEFEEEMAISACVGLAELLEETENCFLSHAFVKRLVDDGLVVLLKGEAACQRFERGKEEEEEEEEEEKQGDAELIECVYELVMQLIRCLGKDFALFLPSLLPFFIESAKSKKSDRERTAAIGCLVLSVQRVGFFQDTFFSRHGDKMHTAAMRAVEQKADLSLRRSGLCLLGALCENKIARTEQVVAMLNLMNELFSAFASGGRQGKGRKKQEEFEAVVDNACGAVCRMIGREDVLSFVEPHLPVILSELLIKNLPLKNDHEEDWVVFDTLHRFRALLAPVKQKLQAVFEHVLREQEGLDQWSRHLLLNFWA